MTSIYNNNNKLTIKLSKISFYGSFSIKSGISNLYERYHGAFIL